jgi:predicted ATP-dependent protease
MILGSLLATRYAGETPLSLAASIVFEQSYGRVDGDSASMAELIALLSAIAEAPLRQDLAITGSVNQHGEMQAIGGVNEKIEGFFDTCAARGLTGTQGVLIPASNVQHLMLKPAVVEACRGGRFHIFAATSLEDAATALTGLPAGERLADGNFTPGSFDEEVRKRLAHFAELTRKQGQEAGGERAEKP